MITCPAFGKGLNIVFYAEILGIHGGVTGSYYSESLEDVLDDIREEVKMGVSVYNVKLYKQVELSFTIDVQVKD